ncbi:MAG TPA: lysophospholipid acyltransferase family protein [Alphaproteobacteria bacterium]|nr:lysophospholipid acyltransferase family protein [Alphaproteobacteria bacterium]
MIFLRSTVFNILFYISTTLFSAALLLSYLIHPNLIYKVAQNWGHFNLKLMRVVLNLDYDVTGLENLPKKPFIVASKHQSAWETVFFNFIFKAPQYVLKRELFYLPFFGQCLKLLGSIGLDRSQGSKSIRQLYSQLQKNKHSNRTIAIFPEGTRTLPGEKASYSSGIFLIYKELNRPVVPVALNSGSFWPKKGWSKKPGSIRIAILPAIEPGLSRQEFMNRLETQIEERSLQIACLKK